ncbi:MAG: 1-deoxy-D-xylulose-5-phosphate synthase, partial [Lachnospiraceae bacterium]|nr:1-deoxy-D-xylulose-5-phosphate synthase [Lachnospiraceae bacterium]
LSEFRAPIEYGQAEWINKESGMCLIAVGSMVKTAVEVREKLKAAGKEVSILNARFVNPIDKELIKEAVKSHSHIVTMEENVLSGGFCERVSSFLVEEGLFVNHTPIAIPDMYVEHGNVDFLKKEIGMDADSIFERILKDQEGLG